MPASPPPLIPRRLFLKLTGATSAAGYAATRPARAGPKPTQKTLVDRGQAANQLTTDHPPDGLWSDTWTDLW